MSEPTDTNATTLSTAAITVVPQDLIDFPLQASTYASVTDVEDERLRASMDKEGQRDPIHVLPPGNKAGLPDYTVLDGHRRRDAAVALGWAEVDVVVRHDLVDADYQEVADAFLDFNSNRRQLDPLDQAVVLVRRHEIKTGRTADRWRGDDLNVVTSQLEPFLDCKGSKTSRRNVKIACLPAPLIEAYRSGRLKITAAERVYTRKPHHREQIADAVVEATRQDPDGKVNELVLDALHDLVPKPEPSDNRLDTLLSDICRAGESFNADYGDGRVGQITHASWGEKYRDRIAEVHKMLGELHEQLDKAIQNPSPYEEHADAQ